MMECLNRLSKKYELMLFSDGLREVHTRIMDKIDPDNKIFSFKLYREHCYQSEDGFYVKDLRVINRTHDSMVLVDNSTCCFGYQLSNGVPIVPFTGDKSDVELLMLTEYLEWLMEKPDVRKPNRDHFKFHMYIGLESMQAVYNKIFKTQE